MAQTISQQLFLTPLSLISSLPNWRSSEHNDLMTLFKTVKHLFHPRRSNNHRARLLHPEVLAILSLLMVSFFTSMIALENAPGKLGHVLGYASNISTADVVAQTNQQRAAQGLDPLKHNDRLSAAAAAKAADMFNKQYWAHSAPDGTQPWSFIRNAGYSYQVAGENLARDFSVTDEMMSAWMASPTHRANIVSDKYTEIGVAVINGNLQGTDTTLVVQMFGTPRVTTAQVAPSARTTAVEERAPTLTIVPVASPLIITAPETTQPAIEEELTQVPEVQVSNQPVVAVDNTVGEGNVLASALIPEGSLTLPPLYTPLQLLKAVFLALIFLIVFTLIYDSLITGNRQVIRMVGHNLSHVLLFAIVAYLIISFKAGILG